MLISTNLFYSCSCNIVSHFLYCYIYLDNLYFFFFFLSFYQQTSTSIMKQPETRVERRYNDFFWLQSHLVALHPECVIPSLPEKTGVMGTMGSKSRQKRFSLHTLLNTFYPSTYHLSLVAIAINHASRVVMPETRHQRGSNKTS